MASMASKAVGFATDYAIDTTSGAIGIASESQSQQPNAYRISGEVVGIGANIGVNVATNIALGGGKTAATAAGAAGAAGGGIASTAGGTLAAGAATGPGVIVAIAVAIAQIVGGIIDAAWNPFKNYFNSDLDSIRTSIKLQLKKQLKTQGLSWPLEVKPNIFSFLSPEDPNYEQNLKEFIDNVKQYYENNGLIFQEDVLKEENLFTTMLQLKRQSKKFIEDENGNLFLIDPTLSAVELQDSDNNNMLLLLALAVYAKKNKLIKKKKTTIDKFIDFIQYNWQIFISLLLILFFFCSIIII